MSRESFTIETVETKPITQGKRAGETFKRAKLSGIGYVSVWSHGDCDFLEENVGRQATAEIEIDNAEKGWKSASAFQKASASASQAAGAPLKAEPDWDAKEDRQRVGILYSVHLKNMLEFHQLYPDTFPLPSYGELVSKARRQTVEDLGWIRGPATGEVPFG